MSGAQRGNAAGGTDVFSETDPLGLFFRRRSIRRFTSETVEEATLIRLLQAAMSAPSAVDSQPWEFIVLTDPDLLRRLRDRLPLGRHHAPAAFVVCGSPGTARNPAGRLFWQQDCSAATENLLLAATALGLGAVWVGVYPIKPLMKWVADLTALPASVTPLAVVYVGHPAEHKPPRTRYDARRVHWQRYGVHAPSSAFPCEER